MRPAAAPSAPAGGPSTSGRALPCIRGLAAPAGRPRHLLSAIRPPADGAEHPLNAEAGPGPQPHPSRASESAPRRGRAVVAAAARPPPTPPPEDEDADAPASSSSDEPTELVLCFERQGEGWAEEIFPRVTLKRRAIPRRSKALARPADPGLAPGSARAAAATGSTSSADEDEGAGAPEDALAAAATDAAAPAAPPPTLRPNRAAGRLRAPRWEPGSLEAFLASPPVGLAQAEVDAVVQAATAWRVTPGGRPLVDRSRRGRAERGASGVVSYLLSEEVGAPPGRAGVGAALLAAPHALLTRPARHDRWDRRFVQLAAFIAAHGHAHVPEAAPGGLGAWAARQRIAWQAGALDDERSEALAAAGFDFGEVALLTDAWEARFDQLVELRLGALAQRAAAVAASSSSSSPSSAAAAAAAAGLPGTAGGDWLGTAWARVAGGRGRALAVWCALQRALRRRALLPDCVASRLDAVGFDWDADEGGAPGSDADFMAGVGDLVRQVERARGAAAREAGVAGRAAAGGGSPASPPPSTTTAASLTASSPAHPAGRAAPLFALWSRPPAMVAPPVTPPPTLTPGEVALQAEPWQRRAAFVAAFGADGVGPAAAAPSTAAAGAGPGRPLPTAGTKPGPPAATLAAPPLDAHARRLTLRATAAWLAGRLPRERAAILRVAGWDPEVVALPPHARGGGLEPAPGDGWSAVADAAADAAAAAAEDALRLGAASASPSANTAAGPAVSPRLIGRWARAQRALAAEGMLAPGRAAALADRDLEWVLARGGGSGGAGRVPAAAAAAPATAKLLKHRVPTPARAHSRTRAASAAALGLNPRRLSGGGGGGVIEGTTTGAPAAAAAATASTG